MSKFRFLRSRTLASGILAAFALPGLSSTISCAQEHGGHDHGDHAKQPTQQAKQGSKGDPYLLDVDPVSGKALGPIEKQVVLVHEGRELRFASPENAKAFQAEPAKYLAAVDAKLVAQQTPLYPLKTCVVSGEELGGEMGPPIDFIHGNRLVRFCCKDCKPKFLADPGKFLAQIDAAVIAAQAPQYPLKTCVVSGEELGGEMGPPIDLVVGNRLLRLCCKDCKKEVAKDPLKFLAKLGKPAPAGHEEHGEGHGHDHDEPHGHDKPQ